MKLPQLMSFETVVILALVAIIVTPFVFIWSLNTLFGLGIDINWRTWLSALGLLIVVVAVFK